MLGGVGCLSIPGKITLKQGKDGLGICTTSRLQLHAYLRQVCQLVLGIMQFISFLRFDRFLSCFKSFKRLAMTVRQLDFPVFFIIELSSRLDIVSSRLAT